jgi:hypothetical protein
MEVNLAVLIPLCCHSLGDDIKQVKEKFGFNPDESYVVAKEVSLERKSKGRKGKKQTNKGVDVGSHSLFTVGV